MNSVLTVRKAVMVCAVVLLGLSFTSWQQTTPATSRATRDTVPQKGEKKVRDLDEALDQMDKAQADLERSMKDIDWEKMQREMKDAMKDLNIDLKKVNEELKKSMQEIDVEKMKGDLNEAVSKIDWEKIKTEIAKVKDIKMDSVKVELDNVKVQMEKLKPELEKSMQKARKDMEKAKAEMQEYKGFINGLEQDGLINKKEGYKIEHKDGQLIINGKQQPAGVYNKYRSFLEKNKKLTIEKNEDDFNINNDR
jgi:hypothetical protein